MISAFAALERLQEGNRRFIDGDTRADRHLGPDRRRALASSQEPFAVILGCSDSRVPVEIVFDQGFGDLFVIRVAGNIAASSQIASVEFAAEFFGTRLVVVLGHSGCGAVRATLDALQGSAQAVSPNLRSIVDRVRPSVEPLLQGDHDPDALAREAVRENVRAAAGALRRNSSLLDDCIRRHDLMIVGAEYVLESGVVDFFHQMPATAAAR